MQDILIPTYLPFVFTEEKSVLNRSPVKISEKECRNKMKCMPREHLKCDYHYVFSIHYLRVIQYFFKQLIIIIICVPT